MNENSKILSMVIGLMYPFVILVGIYIIINGHMTPGGGFQGGAMLASVFMSRYLIRPIEDIGLDMLQVVEKLAFVMILLVPMVFVLVGINSMYPDLNIFYMIAMNILIGIKVCCGLSIVFFRFVFYERR
jgi:multicomponent Na+:H+ antiporter subunit B